MKATQRKDNVSMIAAKGLQDVSFVLIPDLGRSEFSSVTSSVILDSSSFVIRKCPTLLLETNVVANEIQLGTSMLAFCSLRNNAVKTIAKVAIARESR